MASIKKLFAEYKEAHEATEAVDLMDEAKFDEMLDIECDKLDALVNAIMEIANGALDEFEIRHMITSPKYSAKFEAIVNMAA